MRLFLLLAVVLTGGCGDDAAPPDAGGMDAGMDAGQPADAQPDGRTGRDAGCPPLPDPPAGRPAPGGVEHPLDATLRLNQLQAKGSHNSYHIARDDASGPLDYTHAEIEEQLDAQGVRKLELDVWYDPACDRMDVVHLPVIDPLTRCERLTDCLLSVRAWSDAHPGHHALFIQIEPKDVYAEETADVILAAIEREILAVFPREQIITPDEVRGTHPTLAAALAADGWPTLGETRGRVLFYMDRSDALRDRYAGDGSLAGRLIFPDSDPGDPFAGVMVINDPIADGAAIRAAVEDGYIVRTRADADLEQAATDDRTQQMAALASGAQVISTDFPVMTAGTTYVMVIPGGTPSRCNPITAPLECTPAAVEDPALLAP